MNVPEKKVKALERIHRLIRLQTELEEEYGDSDYNVFVFGSYPTTAYVEGESDIDLAVCTSDFDLYKNLAVKIEDFFTESGEQIDLFYIDTSFPAPIYIAPLTAKIKFTDYYPAELRDFEKECEQSLMLVNEKMAV